MELLDLVDTKDNVIGITNRAEAHENGYCHRVVAIFVFTPDGSLLVQTRKEGGLFDHSVGGHVKQGESYGEAAVRELKEELGIAKELEGVGTFYASEIVPNRNAGIVHYFGLYEVRLTNKEIRQITIADEEVKELIPVALEDVAKEMTKNPEKYRTGFMATLNFYINKHGLAIPPAKLQ